MTHVLTLQSREPVTPDTAIYRFDKPEGFAFTPGQGADLALDADGWRDETRPFTFTSLPDDACLEFVIKSYDDHDGVTKRLAGLRHGDTVRLGDPWGAIADRGDGVFVAGGAGITPFIAILRDKQRRNGTLKGNTLVFSNRTEDDIILRETFETMPSLACHFTVSDEPGSPLARGMIDGDMLDPIVDPSEHVVYVCGPDPMMDAVPDAVAALGVPRDRIVTERFD